MRIIIAGSRTVSEGDVRHAIRCCPWAGFTTAVVSGTAKGADEFGEKWALENGIEILRFPADWSTHGKKAGPLRNKIMADHADGLIVVWDGVSRGSKSMIDCASEKGLRIAIFRTDSNELFKISPRWTYENTWEFAEERAGILEYVEGLPREVAEKEAGKAARILVQQSLEG